ncbi:MAG: Spy/CpxP family protein refolding chaperone [Deltaproteobacteria bacterium]|nr:Spy/CpxP family protein refolding chaperone [Deltaproteobacteria bacterium]
MKKLITVVGIGLLIAAVAAPVLAYGPGGGRGRQSMGYAQGVAGNCPGYRGWNADLTDEQRAQLDQIHQKFLDETASIRNDLWAKQGQMRTLMGTSNPDAEKAKALQKEIFELKAKMAEKRIDLALEARKIDPDARFGMGQGAWGSGRHMRGAGPGANPDCQGWGQGRGKGMGAGGHRGGYGPGNCWN